MSLSLYNLFKKVDELRNTLSDKRPLIGISCDYKEGKSYSEAPCVQSVIKAGGSPVLLPVMTDPASMEAIVETLDGIIFSGNADIDPVYLGEEAIPELGNTDPFRDECDFLLLKLAFNRQLPIFGICRGLHLINIAFGGTLYQDIHACYPKQTLNHRQESALDIPAHNVKIVRLYDDFTHIYYTLVYKPLTALCDDFIEMNSIKNISKEIPVNSFHHQAIKDPAPEFFVSAISTDGIYESIEHLEYPIFGVQWRPEYMAAAGDEQMLDLFRLHVAEASMFAEAKELHRRYVTIDSHTDTPMLFNEFDLGRKEGGKVNLPLMEEGRLDAVFMVAYIPQGARQGRAYKKACDYATERLLRITEQARRYYERMDIARTPDDIVRLKREGRKAILLGIENGYAIGKDLSNLYRFKEMGVSYITLCHNGDNDICDSATGNGEWGGLSPFGEQVVAEMNRLGIMIDVSHAADSTIEDILEISKKPIIASHSSLRELCNHCRNLDSDQIQQIAHCGGVVQICLYKGFLNQDENEARLDDVVKHILEAISIVGIDYVGIGSDFDGGGGILGCRAANELIGLTVKLIDAGLNDEDIEKIWGGNLMRVMRVVQAGLTGVIRDRL